MKQARFAWVTRLVGCLALGLASAWGQAFFVQEGPFTDPLHGFRVVLPQGYEARLETYGLLLSDLEAFLLVRGTPLKSPKEAASLILEEARWLSGGQARHFFKPLKGGLLLLTQGLAYPFHLAGHFRAFPPAAYQDPLLRSLGYEAAHLLLPGDKSLLWVSAYLPTDAGPEARRKALDVLRSLEFLPPQGRTPYQVQTLQDPLLGIPAYTAHLPQGYAFQWVLVTASTTLRNLAYRLQGQGATLRKDYLLVQSSGLQTGFGGNAQIQLVWNGQASMIQGFLCAASEGEVVSLLLSLWQQETGKPWQLRTSRPWKETSRVARRLEELWKAYAASMAQGLPFQRHQVRLWLQAQSGGALREALVSVDVVRGSQRDYLTASEFCETQLEAILVEGSPQALSRAAGVFRGFRLGLKVNPEWPWQEAQRGLQANREANQMVLEMNRQSQEFNTWMSRSWTNLLSDQTYVRDPSTGEVFRAYKASFDTGTFWRDPVFGGVVGAVERGGRLEELLRQGGWRPLEQSLSGLPGTWQR